MSIKAPQDYTIDEVCIWLNAIGLGSKIGAFQENSVDGGLLVTLGEADLTGDLGLSNLQARKVIQKIQFSTDIAMGGGGGGGPDLSGTVAALQDENAALKKRVAELEGIVSAMSGPQTRAPAPAPAPRPAPAPAPVHHHPPPQKRGPGVVGGAAGGAAKGAMLGAIGGAIAGDPAKGAKMGAAMGAAGGGMRGLRNRRF